MCWMNVCFLSHGDSTPVSTADTSPTDLVTVRVERKLVQLGYFDDTNTEDDRIGTPAMASGFEVQYDHIRTPHCSLNLDERARP